MKNSQIKYSPFFCLSYKYRWYKSQSISWYFHIEILVFNPQPLQVTLIFFLLLFFLTQNYWSSYFTDFQNFFFFAFFFSFVFFFFLYFFYFHLIVYLYWEQKVIFIRSTFMKSTIVLLILCKFKYIFIINIPKN